MTDNNIFFLPRMSDTSAEALLEEIRRIDRILNKPKLTTTDFKLHAKVGITTIRRRFGTWQAALECAGLGKKFDDRFVSERSGVGRREASNSEILDELRQLAERLGKNSITTDEIRGELGLATKTLINRFGSTEKALHAAGLTQSKMGVRWSDEDRFENLLNVWTALGRPPKYKEMRHPLSKIGGKTYVIRYGTWLKALEAFVERANADNDDAHVAPERLDFGHNADTQYENLQPSAEPKNRREIRLGQRFRVLKRDNFKCVLCGNSPARDPKCTLHVDHILPFSRGGKTTDSNLRSLCAACNVGRGNRYID